MYVALDSSLPEQYLLPRLTKNKTSGNVIYYSLNKKLFIVKLLMGPYAMQNKDWCSRVPIDLVVI